jgi:hypothetical protein
MNKADYILLEDKIWIKTQKQGVAAYDFEFHPLFAIRRPRASTQKSLILRAGPIADYPQLYKEEAERGFELINTPKQHRLASDLEAWYPLLKGMTPRSKVYPSFPEVEELEQDFDYPIFIKGHRQTAKHSAALSIAKNRSDLLRIRAAYAQDAILHWQSVVVREYIALQPLGAKAEGKVPLSYEFRSFWWRGELLAAGPYWSDFADYHWSATEQQDALALAKRAVDALNVPFIVIDLALTAAGDWIIIECNDAQESGYAGLNRIELWQRLLELC